MKMTNKHLCDECKKNYATILYKQTVNGKTESLRLCEECAEKAGISTDMGFDAFPGFTSSFDDMFAQLLFGAPAVQTKRASVSAPAVCPVCKATLNDIRKTSRLGCSQCYTVFEKYLDGKALGKGTYKGKTPKTFTEKIKDIVTDAKEDIAEAIKEKKAEDNAKADMKKKISQLKSQLKKAVAEEDYESAAKLRDEIRAMEAEGEAKE